MRATTVVKAIPTMFGAPFRVRRNDVGEGTGEAISVAARFGDGRLNLSPGDRGIVAVTRYRDGEEMVWRWGPWKNRLRRLDAPA